MTGPGSLDGRGLAVDLSEPGHAGLLVQRVATRPEPVDVPIDVCGAPVVDGGNTIQEVKG